MQSHLHLDVQGRSTYRLSIHLQLYSQADSEPRSLQVQVQATMVIAQALQKGVNRLLSHRVFRPETSAQPGPSWDPRNLQRRRDRRPCRPMMPRSTLSSGDIAVVARSHCLDIVHEGPSDCGTDVSDATEANRFSAEPTPCPSPLLIFR